MSYFVINSAHFLRPVDGSTCKSDLRTCFIHAKRKSQFNSCDEASVTYGSMPRYIHKEALHIITLSYYFLSHLVFYQNSCSFPIFSSLSLLYLHFSTLCLLCSSLHHYLPISNILSYFPTSTSFFLSSSQLIFSLFFFPHVLLILISYCFSVLHQFFPLYLLCSFCFLV